MFHLYFNASFYRTERGAAPDTGDRSRDRSGLDTSPGNRSDSRNLAGQHDSGR